MLVVVIGRINRLPGSAESIQTFGVAVVMHPGKPAEESTDKAGAYAQKDHLIHAHGLSPVQKVLGPLQPLAQERAVLISIGEFSHQLQLPPRGGNRSIGLRVDPWSGDSLPVHAHATRLPQWQLIEVDTVGA